MPVAALGHAAPAALLRLRAVVEPQDAVRRFALPDQCEVALDQQLRRRFRHWTEQFGTRIAVCDPARVKVPSGLRRNAHTLGMIQRDARAADLIEHRLTHATRSVFETAHPYKSPHATAIALRRDGVTLHAARVVVARYPAAHMPFLGERSARALAADIRATASGKPE